MIVKRRGSTRRATLGGTPLKGLFKSPLRILKILKKHYLSMLFKDFWSSKNLFAKRFLEGVRGHSPLINTILQSPIWILYPVYVSFGGFILIPQRNAEKPTPLGAGFPAKNIQFTDSKSSASSRSAYAGVQTSTSPSAVGSRARVSWLTATVLTSCPLSDRRNSRAAVRM